MKTGYCHICDVAYAKSHRCPPDRDPRTVALSSTRHCPAQPSSPNECTGFDAKSDGTLVIYSMTDDGGDRPAIEIPAGRIKALVHAAMDALTKKPSRY